MSWVTRAYHRYAFERQILKNVAKEFGCSVKTLQRAFKVFSAVTGQIKEILEPVNLVFDATFFTKTDGVWVFRAQQKNLYWKEITGERIEYLRACFESLDGAGYHFASFTIDGRKGVVQFLQIRYPSVPVQFCLFHQKMIVQRYTTMNPKTLCGKALKALMKSLVHTSREIFTTRLHEFQNIHHDFLLERNSAGKFQHRRLRSALRSITTNLPYLFTYLDYPELHIPHTTNTCEGSFAHWKEKIGVHRGMKRSNKKKMMDFLLEQ